MWLKVKLSDTPPTERIIRRYHLYDILYWSLVASFVGGICTVAGAVAFILFGIYLDGMDWRSTIFLMTRTEHSLYLSMVGIMALSLLFSHFMLGWINAAMSLMGLAPGRWGKAVPERHRKFVAIAFGMHPGAKAYYEELLKQGRAPRLAELDTARRTNRRVKKSS